MKNRVVSFDWCFQDFSSHDPLFVTPPSPIASSHRYLSIATGLASRHGRRSPHEPTLGDDSVFGCCPRNRYSSESVTFEANSRYSRLQIKMVNARNSSRIQLRSAQNQGNDERSHNQNPGNMQQQAPTPPVNRTIDPAILEAIRVMIVQTIQGMNPTFPPTAPEGEFGEQTTSIGNNRQNPLPNNGLNFARALKTFTLIKPDSYDGTGEPVAMTYWFFHIERLLRNIVCTEAEKVHIASLQLKGGASEWWENTRLAEHPKLSWEMFKNKMSDRFFSTAMREEKLKEFCIRR